MTHTTTTYRLRTPERGVALLSALLFATTILAWTAAVLTSGVAAQQHQRYLGAASQAQDAAESGVNLLIAHLTGPESAALAPLSHEGPRSMSRLRPARRFPDRSDAR